MASLFKHVSRSFSSRFDAFPACKNLQGHIVSNLVGFTLNEGRRNQLLKIKSSGYDFPYNALEIIPKARVLASALANSYVSLLVMPLDENNIPRAPRTVEMELGLFSDDSNNTSLRKQLDIGLMSDEPMSKDDLIKLYTSWKTHSKFKLQALACGVWCPWDRVVGKNYEIYGNVERELPPKEFSVVRAFLYGSCGSGNKQESVNIACKVQSSKGLYEVENHIEKVAYDIDVPEDPKWNELSGHIRVMSISSTEKPLRVLANPDLYRFYFYTKEKQRQKQAQAIAGMPLRVDPNELFLVDGQVYDQHIRQNNIPEENVYDFSQLTETLCDKHIQLIKDNQLFSNQLDINREWYVDNTFDDESRVATIEELEDIERDQRIELAELAMSFEE